MTRFRVRLCCIPLLAMATGAGCDRPAPPYRETLLVFGSEASIEIRGVPRERAARAVAATAADLAGFHRDWHAWEPGALTRVNEALARGESAQVPASIQDLIRRSQQLSSRSGGLFDPGIGALVRMWGFHASEFPLTSPMPDAEQLSGWRARRPRISDLQLEGSQVSSRNPALQLDFGAIAEGVAAEAAARQLAAHGVHDALITLGGDVFALGSADGRAWRVGLRDPMDAGDGVLAGVELNGPEALFSSGNYHKFRQGPAGSRWPHVLDPRSGQPAAGTALAAVLHPDPVLADVAATALMVAGASGFARTLEQLGVHCALLLTDDDSLLLTSAMQARLSLQRTPRTMPGPIGPVRPCAP